MLFFTKHHNTNAIVIKLLSHLAINIDPSVISSELDKHPDYPRLLAISDVLANFNIYNSAYSIELDFIKDVSCPFIAHTKRNNEFVLITDINGDYVKLYDDKQNDHTLTIDNFGKLFTGVVLTVDRVEKTKHYHENKALGNSLSALRIPFAIVGLFLALFVMVTFHTNYLAGLSWPLLNLTLFKTLGVIASILLLVQSIDSNNTLVQKICGIKNSKAGCNNILSSNAATVFKGLTWSEVRFYYFAST